MSETERPSQQLQEVVHRTAEAAVSRRTVLGAASLAGAGGVAAKFGFFAARADAATREGKPAPTGPYSATWASVDQHTPAPEWFQDAKFGIYYHWGVFSVPAYGNEWYPRRMYDPNDDCHQHHLETYGDPVSVFPYNNFIDGGKDLQGNPVQFKPQLKSEGGNFDPDAWAQLFADAGAKYAGPVAEHHDGFSMWDSQVNEWNAAKRGPQLDLVRLHSDAIRGKGLKFMVAMHHAYNFNGYYQFVPQQPTESLQRLFGQLPRAAENQQWYDKLREVVDGYQPDLIWEDFDLTAVDEQQRLNFLSYYYNRAVQWRRDVVATYKDGYDTLGEVLDFERGGPGGILTPYWLTDDSISATSWCYTVGLSYYSTRTLLHSLIDHVSKGGNLLLNIAPMADGTIPDDQQTTLRAMGDYLHTFGESIYSTRAWSTYGEGPTAMGGGSFSGPKAGTPQDIRFTRSKDSRVLYVTTLGWQGDTTTVTSLNSNQFSIGNLRKAELLDNSHKGRVRLPAPTQDADGLHFSMPSSTPPFDALAYVIKLTFHGRIPDWTPPTYSSVPAAYDNAGISDDSNTGAANLDGNGYSLSSQALADAGVTPGSAVQAGGLSFTWPSAASGAPDNVVAGGQLIELTGTGSTLGFLGTSTFGPASGTGTIRYTDGSTQDFALSLPDWYTTSPAGSDAAITMAHRNAPGNAQDQHSVNVFYVGVSLTAGKTVQAVVLPNISAAPPTNGSAAMHLFAIAIG